MGEDEKWSSVCEDGTDFNGDVATEKFFWNLAYQLLHVWPKLDPGHNGPAS